MMLSTSATCAGSPCTNGCQVQAIANNVAISESKNIYHNMSECMTECADFPKGTWDYDAQTPSDNSLACRARYAGSSLVSWQTRLSLVAELSANDFSGGVDCYKLSPNSGVCGTEVSWPVFSIRMSQ